MGNYIHQHINWTAFTWDDSILSMPLGKVRNLQGKLMGKMEQLGFVLQQEAFLATLTLDVLKSTEIEGEFLNPQQVRSSLARRLGMDIVGLIPSDRNVDGIVEVMLDATQNNQIPLSDERLFNWHAALFPTGRSGMYPITIASWRTGDMQVVSGAMGRERVHFQAPKASLLAEEMQQFMTWFNGTQYIDPIMKAGIAHIWFITIHPFDDGNGRIARAITDMQLSKADGSSQRFFSMSAQIQLQRNSYYEILEKVQKGTSDITLWLAWFLDCLTQALLNTDVILEKVLAKARFWEKHRDTPLNERQKLLLNKLMDNFEGKLTSSKWAKIARCSADTALRDIQDLMAKGILQKEMAGGRSTNYELIF
ncbi:MULTISPECIES: Fic family protein [unclassified Arcicella]|uniref:Fic family protein n=1 Tax=unclassified Arcicella TaxID=2644986 RepID=UPI00285E546B|nr:MULTISPECIES: Fic family protein [unclassified Arcicella]MDR6562357.1 Fic family protein [Arcicella sp. BE51]MDR6812251.1 Fic family protein [Arcicella sp. BE140]MDR6823582.1 Fic family protein [Arcicella sp. BE139]